MIIENPKKHLTDQELYTHMKLFEFLYEQRKPDDEDRDFFILSDLGIGAQDSWYVYKRVYMSVQVASVPIFIKKGYNFEKEIEDAKKEAGEKPKKEKDTILKIIQKIQDEKNITIENVGSVSWVWPQIYDCIHFVLSEYKISDKIEEIFRMEINKYLDNFINDKLAITKRNYYKFEAQKGVLIRLIEEDKKIALYGNNFIIKEKIDVNCSIKGIPDFCLIHTVYAMQKLGYLKVVDVWEEGGGRYNSTETRYVNVNIILDDAFIREINNKYKKENPKNVFEKFDENTGILKFSGQDISLSKKGKETDAVLLLKTLLKTKDDDWVHEDEILEDWGYSDEDQKDTPKNKVYFAGLKINNAVALKTQIEDFVECNTSKARINPKYRKIDE